MKPTSPIPGRGHWFFLSNHLHVLACIQQRPEGTIREISKAVGITERATASILHDLETDGYLTRHRQGRRNRYELRLDLPLRHPMHGHLSVGELLVCLDPAQAPLDGAGFRTRGSPARPSASGTPSART